MRFLAGILFWLSGSVVQAQNFHFAANQAIKAPEAVLRPIRQYIAVRDGTPLGPIGHQYPYLPVYKVLAPKEKQFADGVYCFMESAHSSGQLFIYRKGNTTILRNESTLALLTDYTNYLKQHSLPETTQLAYLTAVTAFANYYYGDQKELVKAGALMKLK
ncbi:hypothetical protein [Hymenobacter coccineus]|uniref:Uncharacterized protein n=1 Tax=Hymenobacter coccineus TaxID=1908235 RepID=A0A1G1TI89_9BACT|nr:hypothetical protein [Hymenobacter coccineus]OGX90587.1 hypothetical protein BEN49_22345 [Hymenobacter coccineus]